MLKAWKSPEAPVLRVIVAEEDECEDYQPGKGREELAHKKAQELQAVQGGLHLKPLKFEHIFVALITFFLFLLCKYF